MSYEICVDKTNYQWINSRTHTVLKYFKTSPNAESKCLPAIYWLPKVRKYPTKVRLIIPAPKIFKNLCLN